MNIAQSVLFLYPELKFYIDFIVEDNGSGPVLTWITKEYTEPTQVQLDAAWIEVVKETEVKEKVARMEEINKALVQLGGTNKLTTYTNFNIMRNAKITALEAEFDTIEADLLANYDDTVVDGILSSLFE